MTRHTGIRIAVVGAGPRGISVIERIAANHELAATRPVEILLFDPHPPGGGRVWAGEQPHHLLMNTLCADATHFTDPSVECAGPVVPGPTLHEWAVDLAPTVLEATDVELLREVRDLRPWGHPSRKLLGRYLEWCHERDLEQLPEGMTVEFHQQAVTAVRPADGSANGATNGSANGSASGAAHGTATGRAHEVRTASGTWTVDSVVIATGHSDLVPSPREAELREHARVNGLFLGPPSNPISQDLDPIPAGEKLVVRGLGMNFFDYMSLLTVGRGGRFQEVDGELAYVPSGREPVLVAGSRRGVPYRAKGDFGAMTPSFERRYLTDELLRSLQGSGRQLDFMADLWPSIAKDTAFTYYSVLADVRPEALTASLDDLVAALDQHDWGDPRLDDALAAMVPDTRDRLDLAALDRPLAGRTFADQDELTSWWRQDLARDYAESQLGRRSALKCASVALGAGRAPLRSMVRYGGFTGDSYANDIEGWFRGFGGALASGPPARRIRELAALVDAGIVVPLGPDMRVVARDGAFVASSPAVVETEHVCAGLLEAHLPPANALRSANPLLRQLVDEGLARPYAVPNPSGAPFTSGALDVGREPYALVDARGHEQPGLYVVGVPLESIHWGTQLGPLANTNSRFLRDNDAVARAALLHGKARHALAHPTPVLPQGQHS